MAQVWVVNHNRLRRGQGPQRGIIKRGYRPQIDFSSLFLLMQQILQLVRFAAFSSVISRVTPFRDSRGGAFFLRRWSARLQPYVSGIVGLFGCFSRGAFLGLGWGFEIEDWRNLGVVLGTDGIWEMRYFWLVLGANVMLVMEMMMRGPDDAVSVWTRTTRYAWECRSVESR